MAKTGILTSIDRKKLFINLSIVFGWWAYNNLRTYPLGDKLEYLGKQDLGGGLFMYATRYSEYYYGTDMTEEEMAKYFGKAKHLPKGSIAYPYLRLKSESDEFSITYLNEIAIKSYGLTTNKSML